MKDDRLLNEVDKVRAEAVLLYTDAEVRAALDRMAAAMRERLADRNPLLLCVMVGGMMTTSWLAERLDFPLRIDYVHLTRYDEDTRAHGEAAWIAEPKLALAGRNVLVIDDIHDEGVTLRQLTDYCRRRGAASVVTAVLARKRHDRDRGGVEPDIVGLEVGDRYIFGCGLDYKGYLRNLPGLYAVKEEETDNND